MSTGIDESVKLRGGYYTPRAVADWLAQWAIQSGFDRVLEPSCGDGAFLAAAATQLKRLRSGRRGNSVQLVGVELEPVEMSKAIDQAGPASEVVCADFFKWLQTTPPESFDVVLGNPPFLRYQNFPEPSRTRAMRFMQSVGLHPNRLTNIWVPFVVAGAHLLRAGGRLAMVLPAELLQVSYAGQLRQYLATWFQRITIFACNEMFFADAEQEVVLLAAEGKLPLRDQVNGCDIRLIEASNVAELLNSPAKTARKASRAALVRHDTEKWLKYFLNPKEIAFMRALRENPRIGTLADHASVDVGVVTGKNEFFVLSQIEVAQFELRDYVVPVIGRSAHLLGAVIGAIEHRGLMETGNRVFLLHLAAHSHLHFSPGLRELILEGERKGMNLGYKCRIRDPWYHVPAVWEPDCFLFRQIYDFPRAVVNRAGATSTDTIHRMRCIGTPTEVAANLYTHLTAASSEIEGRSYGGGVLELEPTEAERLLVPKHLNGAMGIDEADALIRQGKLDAVLEHNDRAVLRQSLGLTAAECTMVKQVWAKMRDRRRERRRI